MKTDESIGMNGREAEHVLVGGCHGLSLIRRDELAQHTRGTALVALAAGGVALAEWLMWLVVG